MLERSPLCFLVGATGVLLTLSVAPQSAPAAAPADERQAGDEANSRQSPSPQAEADTVPPDSIATQPPWSFFKWQRGPALGKLGAVAEVKIPAGHLFVGKEDTQKIMELLENPVSGTELGLLMPDRKEGPWLAMFEYSEEGHIKDDDKDDIDADEILKSIRASNEASNEERKARGWATVEVTGWARPPHYNAQTKHLEWAVSALAEGKPVLNYNTRLLGRTGVMSVVLLVAPERLTNALPEYQRVVAEFAYTEGSRYGDYRQGDKLAEYGLAALMVGGGAAVAAKTGLLMQAVLLFKKAWKVLIVVVLAAAAAVRRAFTRLFGSDRVRLPPQHTETPPRDPPV